MKRLNDTIYPLYESHVYITCDAVEFHIDGLPGGPDSAGLPEFYHFGLHMIFHLLERMVPAISCMSVMGIWHQGQQPVFTAFDIWVQTGDEGFHLPMATAAILFSNNGIPYFRRPAV